MRKLKKVSHKEVKKKDLRVAVYLRVYGGSVSGNSSYEVTRELCAHDIWKMTGMKGGMFLMSDAFADKVDDQNRTESNNDKQALRAVVYCRVADQSDHSEYSLKQQERSLRNYANKWGYEIVDVVSECESGTSLEHPGFHKLYELTRSDSVDIILTTDVSTLCRNVRDSIQFCLDIKEHDVDVISTSHGSLTEIADALVKNGLF